MAADVLQRFLTQRLFDVGGDDDRVMPLRQAADDVAALIKAAPQRTATFTMVAIDSGIGPDEPLVAEVMKILEKHWQSYAGAFADDRLPTVARAILLHALGKTLTADPIAAAVSLTARTMLPLLGDRSDRELWEDIIRDTGNRLALRAERDWALPSATTAMEVELKLPAPAPLAPPAFARDWLAGRLQAAGGPTDADGTELKTPNPHWPSENAPWAAKFGSVAAAGISGAVSQSLKEMVEKITAREEVQNPEAAISTYITATANALIRTAVGLERRTALLWWKEALYSPAARVSYRDLNPSVAAALAAIDASRQTGPFAPRVAEALIRETLRAIGIPQMHDDISLVEHGRIIAETSGEVRSALESGFANLHREPGRAPLGAILVGQDPLTSETVAARLGLAPDIMVSAVDLGIWLFRDLQAAAATPAPTKGRRGSRSA